jgi:hypothetical protein
MQDELAADTLQLEVVISGVNHQASGAGVPDMCLGRDLPFLQDSDSTNVWTAWEVTVEDVFVLDEENKVVTVYNLGQPHDLADPVNYETLKSILRNTAGIPKR